MLLYIFLALLLRNFAYPTDKWYTVDCPDSEVKKILLRWMSIRNSVEHPIFTDIKSHYGYCCLAYFKRFYNIHNESEEFPINFLNKCDSYFELKISKLPNTIKRWHKKFYSCLVYYKNDFIKRKFVPDDGFHLLGHLRYLVTHNVHRGEYEPLEEKE